MTLVYLWTICHSFLKKLNWNCEFFKKKHTNISFAGLKTCMNSKLRRTGADIQPLGCKYPVQMTPGKCGACLTGMMYFVWNRVWFVCNNYLTYAQWHSCFSSTVVCCGPPQCKTNYIEPCWKWNLKMLKQLRRPAHANSGIYSLSILGFCIGASGSLSRIAGDIVSLCRVCLKV